MQVYSQKSTSTILPRSMSPVRAVEFTQRSAVKAGKSSAALAAPRTTARSTIAVMVSTAPAAAVPRVLVSTVMAVLPWSRSGSDRRRGEACGERRQLGGVEVRDQGVAQVPGSPREHVEAPHGEARRPLPLAVRAGPGQPVAAEDQQRHDVE